MTSTELLMPAEVAALFRVDVKTVTRWAKEKKLSSIKTVGGHRRYRAGEVYALLKAEERSSRHTRLESLVNVYYAGDPTSVILDLADRYGLVVTVQRTTGITSPAAESDPAVPISGGPLPAEAPTPNRQEPDAGTAVDGASSEAPLPKLPGRPQGLAESVATVRR